MSRAALSLPGLVAALTLTGPARAQPTDPHAGHGAHAGHGQAAQPQPAADPHAGHGGHGAHPAPVPGAAGAGAAPEAPGDHAADAYWPADRMAAARERLRREHGDARWSKVMIETAEHRPDGDGYAWEGEASWGGDIHRLVLKTEGEGEGRGKLHDAEIQALYSRAVSPYFNLRAGVRRDLAPGPGPDRDRTWAAVGVEGLAPYWFEVGATAFVSAGGDLAARLEASYDLRLTQRLVLEPRGEVEIGPDETTTALGLRLRWEIRREFAPYIGVQDDRFVLGLRAWF